MSKKLLIMAAMLLALLVGCSSANTDGEGSQTNSNANKNTDDSEGFPEGKITFIVPFAPGGGTDTAARSLMQYVEKQLPNSSIVVKNVPGGGGIVGLSELYNSEPDGYTIAISPQSPIAIQPNYGETPYSFDSFQTILQAITMPQGMFVQKDAPWKTAEEWLTYVKENPGEFQYGTSAHGGEQHLAMVDLDEKAGIQTEHIPFASGGETITALTGGHIQGAVAFPKIADPTKLRLLFTFAGERLEAYPDIPTVKELGFDVVMDVYFGIIAPEGVPEDRVKIIHDAFKKALESPGLQERMKELGFQVTYADSSAYQKRIEENFNKASEIIEKAGFNE